MLSIYFDNFQLELGRRFIFRKFSGGLIWPGRDSGVIGLMGPSGSGKTSLVKSILAQRYLEKMPGVTISPPNVVVGIVPQVPVLFHHLDTVSNARLFQNIGRYRGRFDEDLFCQLANTLRLQDIIRGSRSTSGLSGGEAQRLMLLRTLSVKPELLILDEPCSGLDPAVREDFLADLVAVVTRLGISTLYVGHHWDEIEPIASQVAYLPLTPDSRQDSAIELSVRSTGEFAMHPPTPEAFQTIHGWGVSIWPLRGGGSRYALESADFVHSDSSGLIACIPPPKRHPSLLNYYKAGRFRLEHTLSESVEPIIGWVYERGLLVESSVSIYGARYVAP